MGVLHDRATAMKHADQVLVLAEGRVEAADAPDMALSREVVSRVRNCPAHWLGEPGERALSIGVPAPLVVDFRQQF
jgi:iron complex transport system ATP-binding protein